METKAVILEAPRQLRCDVVPLTRPQNTDVLVAIRHSGVSAGTERLLWTGTMPPFPGMGYPLVPGYEAVGEVIEAGPGSALRVGQTVFVPGANCFGEVRGLFGGAAETISTAAERLLPVDPGMGREAALLALAATARHAIAGFDTSMPDLIVGHGVLGRLLARLTIAAGAPAPMVWETNPKRRTGAAGYEVLHPDADPCRNYACIFDATGKSDLLNSLIGRLAKGGEIVLAGFYPEPISFAFPLAFMKEARFRVAAEWTREDLFATRTLVESGALSLGDLITHCRPAEEAPSAYETAFEDPDCLKMILDWGVAA
ncbi:chlorophyll synthesis pathway protein BchC [Tropicimonas sp. IMCC34043]|uniref:chlorophyll synthesis pathway protein BchC n=1 Tax=Tropicimonas sp. IMCC34043 TaxID=2248760 RepID=UPI000E2443DC|nr:chlorophyll synthesis pathway protein BchC [Tropicimonas sp. IMCC34043]